MGIRLGQKYDRALQFLLFRYSDSTPGRLRYVLVLFCYGDMADTQTQHAGMDDRLDDQASPAHAPGAAASVPAVDHR